MKRIIQTLVLVALVSGAQSAWSIVRVGPETYPREVTSPYPADAEASFNLPPLDSFSRRHDSSKAQQTGNPFPVNMAGVVIGD